MAKKLDILTVVDALAGGLQSPYHVLYRRSKVGVVVVAAPTFQQALDIMSEALVDYLAAAKD